MKINILWLWLISNLACELLIAIGNAHAQIIPDNTLPVNSSVATGCQVCTIAGGTEQGVNLYHSFQEFSVPTGGEAYFNNGLQIQNILTRVTGTTASNIDGLIRTNGNTNLFFLNPNGISFGANARLQIGGSFYATTANGFQFADGSEFSATNPSVPPLLTVSIVPGLQTTAIPQDSRLQNQGNLNAGQDLILSADQLELQGQLSSGRDLLLRSVNQIVGSARYFAGGNFRIEQVDSRLGDLSSASASVIRANGDVAFNRYLGGSLHILAGGNVTVTGDISISGADANGLVETVKLSNGDLLNIDGRTRRTLDIRAANMTIGTINSRDDFRRGDFLNPNGLIFLSNQSATSGDIQVGRIESGDVVIDARGNIQSSGAFQFDEFLNQQNSGFINGGFINAAGDVKLLAGRSIIFNRPDQIVVNSISTNRRLSISLSNTIVGRGFIDTSPTASGNRNGAGNVTLIAGDAIVLNGPIAIDTSTRDTLLGSGKGGDINIQARSLSLINGAQLKANTFGKGNAGNISIRSESVQFAGTRDLSIITNSGNILSSENIQNLVASGAFSQVQTGAGGNGGNIDMQTQTLQVANGAQISTVTNGQGYPGNVTINATQSVEFDGVGNNRVNNLSITNVSASFSLENTNALAIFAPSGAFSSVRRDAIVDESVRNIKGSVTITTPVLRVTNGARLTSSLSGIGNAGDVTLNANSIFLQGAGPNARVPGAIDDFSGGISVLQQGVGTGGNININTQTLQVADGIVIAALTRGQGDAGRVTINATNSASFDRSFVISEVQSQGIGQGGDVTIATGNLALSNGTQFRASTSGQGDAGKITIQDAQTVSLSSNSSISTAANLGAIGKAGDVEITANVFEASSQGRILTTTGSSGEAGSIKFVLTDRFSLTDTGTAIRADTDRGSAGKGGSIIIQSPPTVELKNNASIAVDSKGIGIGGDVQITTDRLTLDQASITAETASATGGNINLNAQNILLLRRQSLLSATAGNNSEGGDGGNVEITTPFVLGVLAEDSDIRANAFSGNGGRVIISANQIFGLRFQPQPTKFSDITASSTSGSQGTVRLEVLDLDPSRGLQDLNLTPVDPSKLVAQTCNSQRQVVEGESRFVILGRGGLSASPDDPFGGNAILPDLGSPIAPATKPTMHAPTLTTSTPTTIVEAQALVQDKDGAIYLVGEADRVNFDQRSTQIQCQQQ
jgi:filamentous hemagglutinin family protein